MIQENYTPLTEKISRTKILDFLFAMTILIGLSSLPFFHDLIYNIDGALYNWVPDWNIEKTLTDANGKVLGYSQYYVFLYFLLIQVYSLIAWLGWFSVSKSKPYRFAILLGVLSSFYHITLILSNSRKTDLNSFEGKLIGAAIIFCALFLIYYYFGKIKNAKLENAQQILGLPMKRTITPKIVLVWLLIFIASTSPYFHDIITARGGLGVKDWVPQLGIEKILTDTEGYVWGFNSYRAFLLSVSLQVFAQVGWAGWLLDSAFKLYRPFLVLPVGLSLYQIVIILFDQTDAPMNRSDIKLFVIIGISCIVCYFYFFKNKRFISNSENPNKMPQSVHNPIKNN